jgi:putative ABC transport system permease protein
MIATIAFKNLVHEPARFLATAAGIGLSFVLVTVQLGLLFGFDRTISAIIDNAKADLWIVPKGTAAFDDPSFLETNQKYTAAVIQGVRRIKPLVVGYAEWRKPAGGSTSVIIIGSDPRHGTVDPWNVSSGKLNDLRAPDAVAIDASYAQQLGVSKRGDIAYVEGLHARVALTTNGIRSFTTSPYVFTALSQARAFLNADPSRSSYLAVELAQAADARRVKESLAAKLPNVDVLTPAEFRARNLERWLLDTGAGIALLTGTVIAVLVGAVIMTQSLYTTVNDYRREFATFRAMGCSKSFLMSVVACQAGICTLAGCTVALLGNFAVMVLAAMWNLPIEVTPTLILTLCSLAALMSVVATFAAAAKVARVDPASVFAQ